MCEVTHPIHNSHTSSPLRSTGLVASSSAVVGVGVEDIIVGSGEVSLIGADDEVAPGTEEVVAPSTTEDWMTTADEEGTIEATEDWMTTANEEGATEATEDTTTLLLATGGAAALPSSALTQPVLAVRATGQETWVNSTVGLSDPPNQSKRQ